jgi:cellulose synthase (UDP-forming)
MTGVSMETGTATDVGATAGAGGARRGRPTVIRAVAVAALLGMTAYLAWRVTSTLTGTTAWLAGCFLAVEVHALLSQALHTFDLWDIDTGPKRPVGGDPLSPFRVAVLIPTYNEPREVLLPTIAAAVALRGAHETWVLDDGDRPWVATLAERLGARYRTRPRHDHAKAGNLNAILPDLDADLVAVFDADHVAHAGFLARTLPYFADPRVALVQTPQDFYNLASFEHIVRRRGRRFSEQELFYRALAAGRNRTNAAFWCGTNAVLRVAALRDVGGVATGTVTEDIHTTIRLHRRGWRTVYHNEVLAQGLAAANAEQYLGQRLRWGTGAMQVLRTENPAFVSGLTMGQRLSYLSTLLGWFDSWRTLGYLLMPLACVGTGALPVAAPLRTFLPCFLLMFALQRLALRLLARGNATVWHAILFEIIRLPANLTATMTLFTRRARAFTVTAKGRSGRAGARTPAPPLLAALLAGHVGGLAWYAATVLGATPLHYPVPWTAHGAAVWLVVNGLALVTAIRRIRSPRFAAERRASVRFELSAEATVDGTPVLLRDASLTGLSLLATAGQVAPGREVTVQLRLSGATVDLPAVVRSVSPQAGADLGGIVQAGLEFGRMPEPTTAALALALFRTGITPQVVNSDTGSAPGAVAVRHEPPEPRPRTAAA